MKHRLQCQCGSVTGELGIDLIPQDANLEAGELVFTSCIGGVYPGNILIGQVNSVRKEATALFQTATVQPAVDFSGLQIVLVIVKGLRGCKTGMKSK